MSRHERRFAFVAQQAGRHRHGTARIEDMNYRLAVMRRNFDGRVRAAGGRPTDQQRQFESLPLHLACHVHHLVERRSNQAAESNQVRLLRLGPFENLLARDHHPHVDHFIVIAGEHNAHDVLADIVNVSLHRGHDDFSLCLHHLARGRHGNFFRLHERRQMRYRLLHYAGGLHHLRQKHFARAEQIADHAHARHQRAFDD